MSTFILHTKVPVSGGEAKQYENEMVVERVYCTPASVVRFQRKPANSLQLGIPDWAESIVVDPQGFALPVLETDDQIAALHAYASERMWYGFNAEGPRIFMYRYDAEANASVPTSPEGEERRGLSRDELNQPKVG